MWKLDHGYYWDSCPGDDVGSSMFPKRKGRRNRHLGHGDPSATLCCVLGPWECTDFLRLFF